MAVERLEITRVVSPEPYTPMEELETLKWPPVPVEIISAVPTGFPLSPKVTERDVVKT